MGGWEDGALLRSSSHITIDQNSHDPHLGTCCPNMGLGREGVLRGAVHTIPAHQS